MPAGTFNPTIIRGDDYDLTLRFWDDAAKTTPRDVSGSSFASQLRSYPNAPDATDFDVDTTDAATGVIVLSLTPDDTTPLAPGLPAQPYVWDLEETDAQGRVTTQVRGSATVLQDVTHE